MTCTVVDRRLSILMVLTLLIMASGSLAPGQAPSKQARVSPPADGLIAITNATLVDAASGALRAAMTVVMKGDQIADIGRGISVPRGAVRVDGTGKFLIPGLWDMHSHHQGTGAESLDLFLANGVVGTRDMACGY